jgi:pyruvate,water dikinase
LPVPSGFCVTTAAFSFLLREHPALFDLPRSIDEQQLQDLRDEIDAQAAGVRMPSEIERAVTQAWREHGQDRDYAVRSSATVEDAPEHSFAGQFVTCLNVRGRDALLDAILRCWMSVFSASSLAYHARQHLSPARTLMGVVVQEMVPADVSGVLFTSDPISGQSDRILIESVPGLGDQLVSGRTNPARVVLSKSRLRLLRRDPPESNVPNRRAAVKLGRLARTIECLLGRPADVEWAVANGRVFILQARPATCVAPAKAWEDRQVWCNVNTGEVLPDVATPMTWTAITLLLTPVIRSVLHLAGVDAERAPVVGLVAGRVYFNANTGLAAIRPFWRFLRRLPNLAQALGGGPANEHLREMLNLHEMDLPDLGFRWSRYLLSWPGIVRVLVRHSPRRGDAWTTRIQSEVAGLTRVNLEAMSTPKLAAHFQQLLDSQLGHWDLLYLMTQGVALPIFQKACRDWLDDPHLTMGYRLFAGLGGIPEAEAGLALWQLALTAHANVTTATMLQSGGAWSELQPRLAETEPGRLFLEAWSEFMNEHGHHCRGELELCNARWAEAPDYILGIVRGYFEAIGQSDPLENQRRHAAERVRLTEQCRNRLRNPIKRWLFSAALRRAQKLAVNREIWKDQAVRMFALFRRILLILGRRWREAGILAGSDDIFFLEVSELRDVAVDSGTGNDDFRDRIRSRRLEYEANRKLTPPPIVVGRFHPGAPQTSSPRSENDLVLHGIPVSPGIRNGKVRVILRADNHAQILPGEILVAPFTDPAWTPYFVTASGVIMEQGGILSHGSIVAREFGLPAVTNVESVTRRLRTGDRVELDGDRGRVTVLHQE